MAVAQRQQLPSLIVLDNDIAVFSYTNLLEPKTCIQLCCNRIFGRIYDVNLTTIFGGYFVKAIQAQPLLMPFDTQRQS